MSNTPAPVSSADRFTAMDFTRGFALLGILLVNIRFFGGPMAEAMVPIPPEPLADQLSYYFNKIFCESRFYPLFSTLFGMGLALQWARSGDRFLRLYPRRLVLLALMGLCHGLFLWYGDILFMYSTVAFFVMFLVRFSSKTLLRLGVAMAVLFAVMTSGLGALGMFTPPASPASDEAPAALAPETLEPDAEPEPRRTGFEHMFSTMNPEGPFSPAFVRAETLAYRDGPFAEAMLYRVFGYLMILVVSALSFWWHALAMFLIGAGLMKAGFHERGRERLASGLALWGLGLGLPLSTGAAFVMDLSNPLRMGLGSLMGMLAATLMALGYLGATTVLARRFASSIPVRVVARAGQMGLTCYLLETVIATGLMYHWGFGLFGSFSHAELLGVAVAIYAGVVLAANAWMGVFSIGPMEWIWRSWTYLRPLPVRSTTHAGGGRVSG